MSRKRHDTPTSGSSGSSTMIGMAVAAIAVVALVVWALTRTVEPASSTVAGAYETPPPAVATDATTVASSTAPVTFTSDTAHPAHPEKDAVTRISVEDFRPKFDSGNVTIIDVRDSSSYATGHIPGAMNIPFASIQGFTDMIPKGKEVVLYCT
jgi:hypothetical protein